MSRKTYLAWGDSLDPEDLGASGAAVGLAYVAGTEMRVPQNAKSAALDVIIVAKNATNDIYVKLESSRSTDYWASYSSYRQATLVGTELATAITDTAILMEDIVLGTAKHVRISVQESDYLRISVKGDIAGAVVLVFATFFSENV